MFSSGKTGHPQLSNYRPLSNDHAKKLIYLVFVKGRPMSGSSDVSIFPPERVSLLSLRV